MKEIDFLIVYEHKNREFESITLLKYELARRGYTVEFFGFDEFHNKMKRKSLFDNVKIAVMPSLYKDENILTFVYGVTGKAKNIVNLRWEQIFPNSSEQNIEYFIYPKANAKYAYHCCWGQKPYEMLREDRINTNNLFITGPIQMDFLRKELKGIYLDKKTVFKKYDVENEKTCILFTSSFATSSWNKWELDWLYSEYEGEEKEYIKGYVKREKMSRDLVVEWIKKLAETKDCTIIYRPHPAEVKTELTEELSNYKNIKVINKENIKQWILVCDQVYTWNSTSITEAYIAGIPCAVLRPVELEYSDEYQIYEGLPRITDFKQFSEHFDSNNIEASSCFIDNKKLYSYISVDSQKPSYIRTADVLEQALKDDYYFPWNNFDEKDLNTIYNSLFKDNFKDLLAIILVKPFYNSKFMKRVYGKFFGKLYDRYCKMIRSKTPPITNEEFAQMEERIATVLSKNQKNIGE